MVAAGLAFLAWGCAAAQPSDLRLKSYSQKELRQSLEAKGYPRGKTPASIEPTPDRAGLLVDAADPSAPAAYLVSPAAPIQVLGNTPVQRTTVEPLGNKLRLTYGGQSQLVDARFISGRPYGLWLKPDGTLLLASSELPPPTRKDEVPLPRQHLYRLDSRSAQPTWQRIAIVPADRILDIDPDSETLLAERVTLKHLYGGTTQHLASRFLFSYQSGTTKPLPALSGPDVSAPYVFFLRTDPLR